MIDQRLYTEDELNDKLTQRELILLNEYDRKFRQMKNWLIDKVDMFLIDQVDQFYSCLENQDFEQVKQIKEQAKMIIFSE